jgi:hypothetical protein
MSRAEPPTNCCSARSMDVLCRRINVTSRVVNPCGLGSCCRSWHEWAAVTLPDCLTHSLRSPCTFFRQRKRTGARCFPCFGIGKRFTLVRKFVTSRIAETCGILPKSMASCLLVWCVSRKGIEAAGVVPRAVWMPRTIECPQQGGFGWWASCGASQQQIKEVVREMRSIVLVSPHQSRPREPEWMSSSYRRARQVQFMSPRRG